MPEATPKLTLSKKDLAEYLQLKAEKAELDRTSAVKGKRIDALAAHFAEYLKAKGKDTAARGDMVVCYESKPGRVAWKAEFITRLGTKLAEEVAAAVTAVTRIAVKRVAA